VALSTRGIGIGECTGRRTKYTYPSDVAGFLPYDQKDDIRACGRSMVEKEPDREVHRGGRTWGPGSYCIMGEEEVVPANVN
jgi:hypothetical protein